MAKLVHFEITAPDPEALARFYANHFGFSANPSPFVPDYHVLTAPENGISGAVMARAYQRQPAILWFEVGDLGATLESIVADGGEAVGERNTIPGEGIVQYAADPQGNVIGLKQPLS